MKWSMLWDLSVHNMSLQFDHICRLNETELESVCIFLYHETVVKKKQSESFFLSPLNPTVQFNVVHQLLDLQHKQHTNFCKQHAQNLHVLTCVHLCSTANFFQGLETRLISKANDFETHLTISILTERTLIGFGFSQRRTSEVHHVQMRDYQLSRH